MTKHLTPDLIAKTLAEYDGIWVGWTDLQSIVFDKPSKGGVVRATYYTYDYGEGRDVEIECRTFRIVEVES